MRHVHIHVTGIVQGVGMRPFVYREAMAHGICGWVLNAGDGVHIEAHASVEALDGFVAALSEHAPAAARVEHVAVAQKWNPLCGVIHPNSCKDGPVVDAPGISSCERAQRVFAYLQLRERISRLQCA